MPRLFSPILKVGLFRGLGFRLFEDSDYQGAEPYFVLDFTSGIEHGNGKCACGRKLPKPELRADLDDAEATDLAHAILKTIAYWRGREREKRAFAASVRHERQRLEQADRIEQLRQLEDKILSD